MRRLENILSENKRENSYKGDKNMVKDKIPVIGSWANGAYMLIFLFLFVGAIWVVAGFAGIELPTIAIPFALAGAEVGTGGVSTVTQEAGGCPLTQLTSVVAKFTYYNTGTDLDTQGATAVAVYKNGATTPDINTTTLTSGLVTIGNVNCGDSVRLIFGDAGTTYYYHETANEIANSGQLETVVQGRRSSAMTFTVSNTSVFGGANVDISSVGAGATNSDVRWRLVAGADYYGDGAFEVCAMYPISNISKVSFGSSASPISTDPSISVSAGMRINCYQVDSTLWNYNVIELPVVTQAVSGVTMVSANVSLYVNDYSAYLKNGQLIDGYVNTDTFADLGQAVVTTANAVTYNRP